MRTLAHLVVVLAVTLPAAAQQASDSTETAPRGGVVEEQEATGTFVQKNDSSRSPASRQRTSCFPFSLKRAATIPPAEPDPITI